MASKWLWPCVSMVALVGSAAVQAVVSVDAAVSFTTARMQYRSASIGTEGNVQPARIQVRAASSPGADLNHEILHIQKRIPHSRDRSNLELQIERNAVKSSATENHVLSTSGSGKQQTSGDFVNPTMMQTGINSQDLKDAHGRPAIFMTYKDSPTKEHTIARSFVRSSRPAVTEPIYSDGKTIGYAPNQILGPTSSLAAANGTEAVDVSAVASQVPDAGAGPVGVDALDTMTLHKKVGLITFVVLNTVGAATLYLAARLQSRSALVPNPNGSPKGLATINGERKDHMNTKKNESSQAGNNESETDSAAAASTSVRGRCRGFASGLAWRDPNIDLHIGDRSLEGWAQRRRSDALVRLGGCAIMTAVILILEVSAGIFVDSLALISNGLHLLTDVAMYVGLFFAVYSSAAGSVDPSYRSSYSYGFHRMEVVFVLGALIAQYIVTLNIVLTAAHRIWHPSDIVSERGVVICATATASLIINSCLAIWVSRTSNIHSHSHVHGGTATHMARLHLIIDAVQNGIVILAGALLWIDPHLEIVDPLCSFIFAFLVVISTQSFFRQLLHIVMERAPEDLDCDQILKNLEDMTHVLNVHCFHVWSISQGKVAMSVHLHVSSGTHEEVLQEVQTVLKHRYGIHHSTIQISDDEDLACA